jgi:hypothetical protein
LSFLFSSFHFFLVNFFISQVLGLLLAALITLVVILPLLLIRIRFILFFSYRRYFLCQFDHFHPHIHLLSHSCFFLSPPFSSLCHSAVSLFSLLLFHCAHSLFSELILAVSFFLWGHHIVNWLHGFVCAIRYIQRWWRSSLIRELKCSCVRRGFIKPSHAALVDAVVDYSAFNFQLRLLSTDHEKIPAGGWLLWCGSGEMFTTRWTAELLLLGNTTR